MQIIHCVLYINRVFLFALIFFSFFLTLTLVIVFCFCLLNCNSNHHVIKKNYNKYYYYYYCCCAFLFLSSFFFYDCLFFTFAFVLVFFSLKVNINQIHLYSCFFDFYSNYKVIYVAI